MLVGVLEWVLFIYVCMSVYVGLYLIFVISQRERFEIFKFLYSFALVQFFSYHKSRCTLMSFQICMALFILWNKRVDILKNNCVHTLKIFCPYTEKIVFNGGKPYRL